MAKTLNNAGIGEGQEIEAHHVSQSIDAFTGVEDYDISLSGSFNLTGSLIQKDGNVKFEGLSSAAPGNYVAFDSGTNVLSYATTESIITANAAAISGAFDAASASIDATITALSASLISSIGDVSASFVTTIDSVSSSLSSSIEDVTSSLTEVSAAFATTIDGITAGDDDDWYSGSTFITTSRDVYINNSFLSVGGDITGSGNLEVGGFVSASSVTASKVFIYQPNSNISSLSILPELKFKHYNYTDFIIKNDIDISPNRSYLIISSSLGPSPYDHTAWVQIIPPTEFSASNILIPNITEDGDKFLSWDSSTGRIHYTSSTPGGGGSDNDWFDGTTYITTSKDTYITGSLTVSGSTTVVSGSEIYMPDLGEADGRFVTWDISTGKLSYTSSTAGGGGADDDWKTMPGGFITTSYNVQITGAFAQTSSGEVYFKALDNDNTSHYVSYDTSTGKISYESTSSIVTNVSNSLTSSIGDISTSFATTIDNLELGDDDWFSGSGFITTSNNVFITGALVASSSLHQIQGGIIFANGDFDVRNGNIKLGNGLSDNILITGSFKSSGSLFEVTASDFFISSSDIRFPALPNNSSGYYLAYNQALGIIAYNSTSSLGGNDNDWYEGSGFITTSNNVLITGSTNISGSLEVKGNGDGILVVKDLLDNTIISINSSSDGQLLEVTNNSNDILFVVKDTSTEVSSSFKVTGSTFDISSSNYYLKGLSNTGTENYIAYNPSTGEITYYPTSSIAGGGVDDDWQLSGGILTTSYNVSITGSLNLSGSGAHNIIGNNIKFTGSLRVTGSTFESANSTFEVISPTTNITSNNLTIDNNSLIKISSSNIGISSSDTQVYIADECRIESNIFKVEDASGANNRFKIDATGSRLYSGSIINPIDTDANISVLTLSISSSYYQFARRGSAGFIQVNLPSGSVDLDGLTFEFLLTASDMTHEFSSSEVGIKKLTTTNEAYHVKCIYSYTFDNAGLGSGTGWVVIPTVAYY